MADETGHSSVEDLVETGFLSKMKLNRQPEQQEYAAYLVHYSGWEDPEGMLADGQLKVKFDEVYPSLKNVVRIAERGQLWSFT